MYRMVYMFVMIRARSGMTLSASLLLKLTGSHDPSKSHQDFLRIFMLLIVVCQPQRINGISNIICIKKTIWGRWPN